MTAEHRAIVEAILAASPGDRERVLQALRERMCLKCNDMYPQARCYCDHDSGAWDVIDD